MFSKISGFILGNAKALVISIAVFAVLGTGIFIKGCNYGENKKDAQWQAAIANSKPVEVRRDTVYVPQKPNEGKFKAELATISDKYQRIVDQILQDAQSTTKDLDSLAESNRRLERLLRASLSPKMIHLVTPEIGDLILQYFPADSTSNIFRHIPPPAKVVTVYTEKLVLEPRSTWETVGYIALGAGVGTLVAVIAHIK